MVAVATAPFLLAASKGRVSAPVASCGATVTGTVTLSADLPCSGSNGLVVGANNVTINLNGHVLSGDGTHFGILDSGGFTGLTVENGVINDFLDDVDLFGGATGARITASRIEFAANVGVIDNTSNGMKLAGDYIVETSGTGVSVAGSTGTSITGSWIEGNSGFGVSVSDAPSLLVSGDKILDNSSGGIDVGGASTGSITGNVVNDNGVDGISAGPTVTTVKPGLSVSKNRASFNAQWGILAPGAVVFDGGGNVVQGNGNAGQCQGVVCNQVSS